MIAGSSPAMTAECDTRSECCSDASHAYPLMPPLKSLLNQKSIPAQKSSLILSAATLIEGVVLSGVG